MKKAPVLMAMVLASCATLCGRAQSTWTATVRDAGAVVPGDTLVADSQDQFPPVASERDDITPLPGWPVTIGSNTTIRAVRGVVFADLNEDGSDEIVAAGTDSKLYAWTIQGALLPGFPVSFTSLGQYPPAIADIDGDGHLEIVLATRLYTNGGRLYVFDHTGVVRPGYPISLSNHMLIGSPTLYDLDLDGMKEIIIAERAYPVGYIRVFRPDGTQWSNGWPFTLEAVPAVTPAVGDVDHDGSPEIVYMSYGKIHVIRMDGTEQPGWPVTIPNANFSYQSPALADINYDGLLEIVVGAHGNAPGCYVYSSTGMLLPGWPFLMDNWTYCPPVVADLEGDGAFEIIDGFAGHFDMPSACFWVWSTDGQVRPGFPWSMATGGGSEGAITVADVNGDGRKEIFADHNVAYDTLGFVFGVDADGNALPGFPLRPHGLTYMSGATLGDIDHDGHYELAVATYYDTYADITLYRLPWTYGSTAGDWPLYHANNARDGLYRSGLAAGDLNCDGVVNFGDINPFVEALLGHAAWIQNHPACPWLNGDCNFDGTINFGDINPFVALLVGAAL